VLPADLSHFLTFKHSFSAANIVSLIYNSRMEKFSDLEKKNLFDRPELDLFAFPLVLLEISKLWL
jgi:hypothetical protein